MSCIFLRSVVQAFTQTWECASLHPSSPFLPPVQRVGAWALALNSDPACNQSYPWARPYSQATALPLHPPTSFLPLCPGSFPFPSQWIQDGHAGFWWGATQRQCRANTPSVVRQQAQGTTVSPSPSICALHINLCNDLELMGKWWCQTVRTGQLVVAQQASPILKHSLFSLCLIYLTHSEV